MTSNEAGPTRLEVGPMPAEVNNADPTTVDAWGYLRVSTHDQGDSGAGLDDQRNVIRDACAKRHWTVELIQDVATGKNLDRPGLTMILERIRPGQVLVAAKLDRLSRSLIDFASLMERAKREGWSLVVLDCDFDMTTPAGELMVTMLAAFAQFERRLISERTKAALHAKVAAGVRVGRPRLIDPSTAALIVTLRESGLSVQKVADRLNADGVPTVRGGPWRASTVSAVLSQNGSDSRSREPVAPR